VHAKQAQQRVEQRQGIRKVEIEDGEDCKQKRGRNGEVLKVLTFGARSKKQPHPTCWQTQWLWRSICSAVHRPQGRGRNACCVLRSELRRARC
jgi:hypothetical protein